MKETDTETTLQIDRRYRLQEGLKGTDRNKCGKYWRRQRQTHGADCRRKDEVKEIDTEPNRQTDTTYRIHKKDRHTVQTAGERTEERKPTQKHTYIQTDRQYKQILHLSWARDGIETKQQPVTFPRLNLADTNGQ